MELSKEWIDSIPTIPEGWVIDDCNATSRYVSITAHSGDCEVVLQIWDEAGDLASGWVNCGGKVESLLGGSHPIATFVESLYDLCGSDEKAKFISNLLTPKRMKLI